MSKGFCIIRGEDRTMNSISQYTKHIEKIDISEKLNDKIVTVSEAEKKLALCNHYLHQLTAIKTSIALDINKIRAKYRRKISQTSSILSRVKRIFNKNGAVSKTTLSVRRDLMIDRDTILESYQQLKFLIEYHRKGIKGKKYQINDLILEIEISEIKKEQWFENQSNGIYCNHCDTKISSLHRYCCQCGIDVRHPFMKSVVQTEMRTRNPQM